MAKKTQGEAIISELNGQKAAIKAEKQAASNAKAKEIAHSAYITILKFGAEVIEAAFAYIGVTTFIHTSANVQTGIAAVFVALILIVKFNIKR